MKAPGSVTAHGWKRRGMRTISTAQRPKTEPAKRAACTVPLKENVKGRGEAFLPQRKFRVVLWRNIIRLEQERISESLESVPCDSPGADFGARLRKELGNIAFLRNKAFLQGSGRLMPGAPPFRNGAVAVLCRSIGFSMRHIRALKDPRDGKAAGSAAQQKCCAVSASAPNPRVYRQI